MIPAPRRWHDAPAGEEGGADAGDGGRRGPVDTPESADGERRRRTLEALRRVEHELERTRALLDGVLRRAGADPDEDDPAAGRE